MLGRHHKAETAMGIAMRLAVAAGACSACLATAVLSEGQPVSFADLSSDWVADDPKAARKMLGLTLDWDMPTDAPPPLTVKTGPLLTELSDLRAFLTQLAIETGANDHLTLFQAQSGTDALVLINGEAHLADLAALHPTVVVSDEHGGWRLTRPLFVLKDARLRLEHSDQLAISTKDGAFLVVFGQIEISGTVVSATAEANPTIAAFRPFLLSVGSAELRIDGARFDGLGMANGGLFAGITHVSSRLFPPETPPDIRNSWFQDSGLLSLREVRNGIVVNNRITGRGGIDIVGGSHLILKENLLADTTSTFALRLSGGVRDSVVQGTSILRAKGTGLSISGLSRRIVLGDTLLDRTSGDGVALERASCIRIEELAVTRGLAVGLRVKSSGLVAVEGANIFDNARAGIAIESQPTEAAIQLSDVTMSGNSIGLKGQGVTEIELNDVQLGKQLPQLFSGDLAPFTGSFLSATQQMGQTSYAIEVPYLEPPAQLVTASASAFVTPSFALLPITADPWAGRCEQD